MMHPVDPLHSGTRRTFRHGDLRKSLVAAALAMAQRGGPDAIVLREATRQAGVAPNAAYRHFVDRAALVAAVSDAAQGIAVDRIEREIGALAEGLTAAERAHATIRAIGYGYVAFAREEPGLFRTAFTVPDDLSTAGRAATAGVSGNTTFQLIGAAIDALVECGELDPARRPNAEFLAWAAVHGLGVLVIDGEARGLSDLMVDTATTSVLDMVERGL